VSDYEFSVAAGIFHGHRFEALRPYVHIWGHFYIKVISSEQKTHRHVYIAYCKSLICYESNIKECMSRKILNLERFGFYFEWSVFHHNQRGPIFSTIYSRRSINGIPSPNIATAAT